MGVVGAIVPWNYPLLLLSWKLAPALAASNASGQAVGADAALDARAGGMLHHLPPGVPNLLAGAGDGRIDCVAFTGSVDTGKRIAATCAERVARTGSARPSTRATCGRWSGACTRSRPGPFVQRSADRQRRRPFGGYSSRGSGVSSARRDSRPSRRPSTCTSSRASRPSPGGTRTPRERRSLRSELRACPRRAEGGRGARVERSGERGLSRTAATASAAS